jgi:nucleoside-diphosphate-sugar epimerase
MRIWVTGEAGFIARNLSDWCDTHNHQVINRLDESYFDYWRSSILKPQKEINIFDPTLFKLIQDAEVDVIVHTASIEYDDTMLNPSLAIHTNIEGSYVVSSIAKKLDVPIIYLSSIGKNVNLFTTTKYSGEQIIRHTTSNHVIVKPAIVYGKFDAHSPIAKILKSIRGGTNTFPLDIDANRSYLYIDDLMSALCAILENINSMFGDAIEIGSDVISFDNLFEYINEELNICPDCTFLQAEDLMGDIYTDSSYITSLGWKPKIPIREGIKKTFEFFNQ